MRSSIPLIPDERVRSRYAELGIQFDNFLVDYRAAFEIGVDVEIGMDEGKLLICVHSYFSEISRYKWWHFPENPEEARLDGYKKAAYMAYWINKIAPIYTKYSNIASQEYDESGLPQDPSSIINLYFVLYVCSGYLGFMFHDKISAKLLYHMLYREMEPRGYLLLFESIGIAASEEDAIVLIGDE